MPDSVICLGDSILLNNINDTLFSYLWQPNTMIDCDTCATPVAFPASSTLYTVSISHIPGCSFSDSVLIDVNDIPNVFLGADTSICQGNSITLNPNGDTNLTWIWGNPNGLNCTQCSSPSASPNNTNFYIAQAFNGNCTASDSIMLTILPLPQTSAGNDQSICLNDSLVLTASGGDSLFWSPGTFLSDSIGDSLMVIPDTNITYTVTGLDTLTGCINTDSITVIVFPLPTAKTSNDSSICSGNSINIGNSQSPSNTYTWSPSENIDNSSSSNPLFLLNTTNDTLVKYILTVSSSNGCTAKDSIEINIHPNPVSNAGTDTAILKGGSITLTGLSGDSYSWSPSDFLSKTDIFNPVSTPEYSITYTLLVSTIHSCWDTSDINIKVYERPVVFPQAFSPNSDGSNDLIGALGIDLSDFHLLIFNRWGTKVFETKNVFNHWDGIHKGQKQGVGTYVYVMSGSYNGQEFTEKGNFTLLR
jgi:gliding motility-associated-like protein